MIHHDSIQKVIDTAQIMDVVQDYVSLKKRGVNYLGICPFHNEKTPSFTVSPAKGIFKCFGCGEAGNSVSFIMKNEQMSFTEAIRLLAKKYHIDIIETQETEEQLHQKEERESLMVVNSFAQKYFSNTLYNSDEGISVGLSYFKERGFSNETIQKFQLGYSPEKRDAFTNEALKNGYKLDYLAKTGLSVVKEDGYKFDRFAGRVMFPIHSISGQVIAFGGRILKTDKTIAKYLNSPESDVYHKSDILYGIYFAKKEITKHDKCFLVEGYTDVISMNQAGIENVVASSGTSLTTNQIRMIKRFTPNLTILYDGDPAGIKASLRGIDMVLEEGMNVKVLLFPDGDDPDSFARKYSAVEVRKFIEQNEENFITFKARLLINEAQSDPVKRATLVNDIVRSVAIIPDAILRSIYIKECSKLLSVKEQALYDEINKIILRKKENDFKKQQSISDFHIPDDAYQTSSNLTDEVFNRPEEEDIIYFLLKFGNRNYKPYENENTGEVITPTVAQYIISEIVNDELDFKNKDFKAIFDIARTMVDTEKFINERDFINNVNDIVRKLAIEFLSEEFVPSKLWEKHGASCLTPESTFMEDVPKAVISFKSRVIMDSITALRDKLNAATEDEQMVLLQQIMDLDKIKMHFQKLLGNRTVI